MAVPVAVQKAAKAPPTAEKATGSSAKKIYEGGRPRMAILMLLLLLGTRLTPIELCDKMADGCPPGHPAGGQGDLNDSGCAAAPCRGVQEAGSFPGHPAPR